MDKFSLDTASLINATMDVLAKTSLYTKEDLFEAEVFLSEKVDYETEVEKNFLFATLELIKFSRLTNN